MLSGPMFEVDRAGLRKVRSGPDDMGAHYSVWHIDAAPGGGQSSQIGMQTLRGIFPTGEADENNFVLFSTSGIHGTYATIEDIEASLMKYGEKETDADDYYPPTLTTLIVHPRIVCLRCGNVQVTLDDIPYLKKLRDSSHKVAGRIGRPDPD